MELKTELAGAEGRYLVTLTVPDGWQQVAAEGVILAVGAPVREGIFRANVTVTAVRVSGDATLEEAVAVLQEKLRGRPEMEPIAEGSLSIAGLPARALEAAWRDVSAGTVAQTVRLVLVGEGGTQLLLEAVGSCGGAQAESDLGTLRGAVDNLGLVPLSHDGRGPNAALEAT